MKKILCFYGCGNLGKYVITKSKKLCCSDSYHKCEINKKKISEALKLKHQIYGRVKKIVVSSRKGLNKNNNESIRLQSEKLKQKYANGEIIPNFLGKKHSEETKEKIRKKRFEYLKQKHGKTAWERRAAGELSYLEKWFFEEVILKNNLHAKYDIINEYSEYPYFIDFAFINLKLAVELDGACHFKNGGNRLEHDIKKDYLLTQKGWRVFRISYKDDKKSATEKLLIILDDINALPKIYEEKVYRHNAINNDQKIERHKNKKIFSISHNSLIRIDLIRESKIDFKLPGWNKKISNLTNIRTQHVLRFMRKYLPEILEHAWLRKRK